jgi:hypothetical protein
VDRTRRWTVVAVVAGLALVGGACGDNSDDDADSVSGDFDGATEATTVFDGGGGDGDQLSGEAETSETAAASDTTTAPASDSSAAAPGAVDPAGGPGETPPITPLPTSYGRDVIFTAAVDVEVDDVGRAADDALVAVQAVGGFLFGQQTVSDPEPHTVLVFKVPPSGFPVALDGLGELGTLLDQTVSADDVTSVVVDLESRITTAEASVTRLRALIDQAVDIPTIVSLETELRSRETELETLRGQLRTVQDQVSLATITLTLSQAPVPVPDAEIRIQQALVAGSGKACPEELRHDEPTVEVAEDDVVTVCYVVTNEGEVALTELTLLDDPLDVETDDLTVVDGSLTDALAPDARLVLSVEVTAVDDVRSAPTVRAVPVDGEGAPLGDAVEASTTARITLEEDGLPGIGESMGASAGALVWIGGVLLLVVAVAVPFLWIPAIPLVIALVIRRRERRRAQAAATSDAA